MLDRHEPWWIEGPPADEPLDLLTIPEIRREIAHRHRETELGLRSLLEKPDLVCAPRGAKARRRTLRRIRNGHRPTNVAI